jgi:hypothetical protein
VGHAMGSGIGPQETQKILIKMVLGGSAIVSGMIGLLGAAQGKSAGEISRDIIDALNPASGGKFMSMRIGDQYYGIGGGYRALLRFIGDTINLDKWENMGPDLNDKLLRNPLTRYARSKMPMTVGSLADVIDKQDFLGAEFTLEAFTEDPVRFAEALMDRTVPFPVQAFIEARASGLPTMVGAAAGEFVGGRAVRAESPQEYWQFDRYTRNKIETDPRFTDLYRRAREATKQYNPRLAEYYEDQDMKRERVFGEEGELARLATLSESRDPEHPMELYRKSSKRILHDFYRDRQQDREMAEERGVFRDRDPDGPFRTAEDIYARMLFADDRELMELVRPGKPYIPLEDELTGEFNWDERNRRVKYLEDTYGAAFVRDMKESSLDRLPEAERKRREASGYIAGTGYWDVDKTLASQNGVSADLEEYERLQRSNKPEAKKFLAEHEVLRKGVINRVSDTRRAMRLRNPDLDEVLMRYGYVSARAQLTTRELFRSVRRTR